MKGEALRGHLDMLILATVEARGLHGYAIIEDLRRRSGGEFDLAEGTVYPVLHRLEGAGLLTSRWKRSAGRRRRVYRLTGRGRALLARQREEWMSFAGAVASVVGVA